MADEARVAAGARPGGIGGRAFALLLVLFFGSGVSGLVYELVWLRHLTLVFGVTIYAVSTVLSAFMGGLALGGYLAGRVADRIKRPLGVYGVIEIAIGISALLTPAALGVVQELYAGLYRSLPHDLTTLSLVRFVLACAVLLVPTTLMGATLPIVVRSALGRSAALGTNLSLLYASNTAGGIAGVYLAGFILIGAIGIRATTVTAAAINVAVGLVAIAADWWLGSRAAGAPDRTAAAVPAAVAAAVPQVDPPAGALRLLLAALFVSGFASLGYQVIWTRILAIYFEATTYAFTLILCTFLLGIALGSCAVTPLIERRTNWLLWAALMEWGIGLSALVSIAVISRLHPLVDGLRRMPLMEHAVSGEQRTIALMCFVTIIPTTLLLGAAFPVITRLYVSGMGGGEGRIARRLGRAYAANVSGAIAGSWASGFVLIPLLGTHRALVGLAAANALIGLALLRYALRSAWARRSAVRPAVLVPAGVALAVGAIALTPDMYGPIFARFGDKVLWYEEGLEQTVTILEGPSGRRMYLNGWHQANDTPSMLRLHTLIGHLPMLVQPAPGAPPAAAAVRRTVLVIGLGGGATAGAAAAHDGASLRVVELSPSVVRGATFFSHANDSVVRLVGGEVVPAPNVAVHVDDGRNHLLLTQQKYDVIMADAIRPRAAGSATLYSLEYYALVRRALADDGVMVQWIDGEVPDAHYRMLLRTLLSAFPYVTGWADGALYVASHRPYVVDREAVRARVSGSARRVLEPLGIVSPEAVLSLFMATDAELRAWVGPGPIVTDDHPRNEFFRALGEGGEPADVGGFRRDARAISR